MTAYDDGVQATPNGRSSGTGRCRVTVAVPPTRSAKVPAAKPPLALLRGPFMVVSRARKVPAADSVVSWLWWSCALVQR